MIPLRDITWVIPYYRNPNMLKRHIEHYSLYPEEVVRHYKWIYIDDGSPEHQRPDDILRSAPGHILNQIRLFRVLVDIPFNQHGARNLGAREADTEWLLLMDMDRCMTEYDAYRLIARPLVKGKFYKPTIMQVNQGFIISPCNVAEKTINLFTITKSAYWQAGGYDEDYCGTYGGDQSFINIIKKRHIPEIMPDVRVLRYRPSDIKDSSTTTLSREEYRKKFDVLKKHKIRTRKIYPKNPIRFPWEEIRL